MEVPLSDDIEERVTALEIALVQLAKSVRSAGADIAPVLRRLADEIGIAAAQSRNDAMAARRMAISGSLSTLAEEIEHDT